MTTNQSSVVSKMEHAVMVACRRVVAYYSMANDKVQWREKHFIISALRVGIILSRVEQTI